MRISPTLPKIRLLATGGTIAGSHNEGGGYESAAVSAEALLAAVPGLASLAVSEVGQVFDLPFLPRRRV